MKRIIMILWAGVTALLILATPTIAQEGIDDPLRTVYRDALQGKTVAFVPLALGFDLTDGWWAGMKSELEPLGVKMQVRDPNWNTEAGARVISSLIAEKPDVMVVHNPDVQTYAKLLRRAENAGIRVVQINMKSAYVTDAFVGADWVEIGEIAANTMVSKCGSDTSGEIAIVQGVLTAAASAYQLRGIMNVLNKHSEIKVVSNQAADWDATKARAITETTLQQNPNLCGIIGFWDGMDVGTGAAIKEAGRQDNIYLVTSGGGGKSGCDNLANDVLDMNISYDVPGQARDLSNVVKLLLQASYKPGEEEMLLYTKLQILTKDNMEANRINGACWAVKDLTR